CDAVHDGEAAVRTALAGRHVAMVLDVMMPRLNGFEVVQRVRKRSALPIIMLTARGEDVDRIIGLEMGADDYLAKPFNSRELAARLRAVLRRGAVTSGEAVREGDVALLPGDRGVQVGGVPVPVTGAEFGILEVLLRRAGQVVSRETLCERGLGRPLQRYDRSVDTHVSSLRKKLGAKADGGARIKAVRGQGYILVRDG
ncbi:MAG: winged helix-turn-helix domain-containing protein, partial [Alphaproteobacteria bacterium]